MSRGFGVAQSKRRSHKSPEQRVRASQVGQCNLEGTDQASSENDQQSNQEEQSLAWYAGVYNPLFNLQPSQIRPIEADEEEWLFLARVIGWLKVHDEMDAVYFTAPPPAFDQAQADWYLHPVLTAFLEEPTPLREVMVSHPIPQKLLDKIIARHTRRLKWHPRRTAAFIEEISGKSSADLTNEDYTAILLELQRL